MKNNFYNHQAFRSRKVDEYGGNVISKIFHTFIDGYYLYLYRLIRGVRVRVEFARNSSDGARDRRRDERSQIAVAGNYRSGSEMESHVKSTRY